MKEFRLSLLLALLVAIGMGGALATATGEMAAPHATLGQDEDANRSKACGSTPIKRQRKMAAHSLYQQRKQRSTKR